ncbi:DUF4181 domain-containing protein [Alkalihalophilus lindianensis]|uniref:DUF4181 domain-containing protein n=1 Tax=Alkalihalophilus lindianensis TaxID=1630542 RepID=A0ABU3X5P8_9BACI|nr:DUF4181 domain-containing protein [Alkalihalophilus lindianensis]MDV2682937.1 DUF4181 domain-containing protein [Alkalihalophilus lindianensis]
MGFELKDLVVIGLLLILLSAFLVCEFWMRRRKQQSFREQLFKTQNMLKDRNQVILVVEIHLFVAFIVCMIVSVVTGLLMLQSFIMLMFFSILHFLRGIEHWKFKRKVNEYQHYWLASFFTFCSALVILFGSII